MAPHSCKDCLRVRTMAEKASSEGSLANGHGIVNGSPSTSRSQEIQEPRVCKLGLYHNVISNPFHSVKPAN